MKLATHDPYEVKICIAKRVILFPLL